MLDELKVLLPRELRAVKRQIESYPDDASVWKAVPGLPNSAGTLALHVAGNLRHFVGATLGRDGYERDRDAEFSRRDVPRREIAETLDAAIAAVTAALDRADDATLAGPWPEPIAQRRVSGGDFALHLAAHVAYHLGQIDYHRRLVTGNGAGLDSVSVRELPEV